jgi:hypothetical protein
MGRLTILAQIVEAKLVEADLKQRLHMAAEKSLKNAITVLQVLETKLRKKEV